MKHLKLTSTGADRAVLLFLGWGMDAGPFADVALEGYDVVAVWDYRDDRFDDSVLAPYREVVVAAWSLGVFIAARFMAARPGLNVTLRIAFNGTLYPADDLRGIPVATYRATGANLNERSLRKFYRRMFASAEAFAPFAATLPLRDVKGLVEELDHIHGLQLSEPTPDGRWDMAVVADGDRIVPPEAQLRAWEERAYRVERRSEGSHYVDFNAELRRVVADKGLIQHRFRRSGTTYRDNAAVQARVASHLADMITQSIAATPGRIIEIGAGTGILTERLATLYPDADITAVDLVGSPQLEAVSPRVKVVEADGEWFISTVAEGSADLIATSSTIQWFNSIPSFFMRCQRATARGGIVAAATYGSRNFEELDSAGVGRRRFASLDELRGMVPDGFEIIASGEEIVKETFGSAAALLRHLRATGVNATDSGAAAAVSARRLLNAYPLDADGRATLTFNPVYIILKRK